MKGFTLIEILIATTIFALIITLIGGVLFLSSRIYLEGEKNMEIMQNARVVFDALSRELRQSRRVASPLSEDPDEALDEIIFQDGHLEIIIEEGITRGGQGKEIVLDSNSSSEDDFYKDAYLKIVEGPSNLKGEIRKINGYDGEERVAILETPFDDDDYFGLEYVIDTSYYYIRYYLDDYGFVRREVFAFYFSGEPSSYVPFNLNPPLGETMEKEILEESRIIGEHFESILFWGENPINVSFMINLRGKEVNLEKRIFGRNL